LSSLNVSQRTNLVKEVVLNHGFLNCGISQSGFLETEAPRLDSWLQNGYHGSMQWMENHYDKRSTITSPLKQNLKANQRLPNTPMVKTITLC